MEPHVTRSQAVHQPKIQIRGDEMAANVQGNDAPRPTPGSGQVAETGTGQTPRPTNRNSGSIELGSRKA